MLQIAIGVSLVILATILHGSKSVEAFQIRTSNPKKKIAPKKLVPPKRSPAKKTVVKTIKPVVSSAAVYATAAPDAQVSDYDRYKIYKNGDVAEYRGNTYKLTNTIGAAGYAPDYPGNQNVQQGAGWVLAPASVMIQGFQSYQNPYNSSPAVQQSLEFRLGQNSYSKQVQSGWLI